MTSSSDYAEHHSYDDDSYVSPPAAALVTVHRYSGGTVYYVARCETHNIVLNSGHHYRDRGLAQAEADRHNSDTHNP